MTTKLTLSQLSSLLFRACDDLRGNMGLKKAGLMDDLLAGRVPAAVVHSGEVA